MKVQKIRQDYDNWVTPPAISEEAQRITQAMYDVGDIPEWMNDFP